MRNVRALLSLVAAVMMTRPLPASTPSAPAVGLFEASSREVEQRLRTDPCGFVRDPSARAAMQRGTAITEVSAATPSKDGALLHHWRGATFAAGAHAQDFEHLLRDFSAYPKVFAPDVAGAKVLNSTTNALLATLRLRQHHVITVVLDATYDVRFGAETDGCGYSLSRSRRIDEIGEAGTRAEHTLSPQESHGFLWRQDVFWSYVERDGGLYLQIETVSLSRDVPAGLGWAVRPFLESIPRESLAFTLASAVRALRK